jgi:AcrR family transcriptional regulator
VATNDSADLAGLSLRERKKQLTRRALIDVADAMFAERGFDNVTVAEIADAVNVAPKTVFVYFSTKEDLVFHGEDDTRDELLAAIRDRAEGQTPLDALRGLLASAMNTAARGPVAALDRLLRTVGDSVVLQSRMRLMWERFEVALAAELARELGTEAFEPAPRIAAAQLVLVFRMTASPEVLAYVRAHAKSRQRAAFTRWLDALVEMIGGGIGEFARR